MSSSSPCHRTRSRDSGLHSPLLLCSSHSVVCFIELVSEELREITKQAKSLNLVVNDVPRDGNCFLTALSMVLKQLGIDVEPEKIRSLVVEWFEEHDEHNHDPTVAPNTAVFVETASGEQKNLVEEMTWLINGHREFYHERLVDDFVGYIAYLSVPGHFVEFVCCFAIPDIFNVMLHVLKEDGNVDVFGKDFPAIVTLGHCSDDHFVALIQSSESARFMALSQEASQHQTVPRSTTQSAPAPLLSLSQSQAPLPAAPQPLSSPHLSASLSVVREPQCDIVDVDSSSEGAGDGSDRDETPALQQSLFAHYFPLCFLL